MQKQIHMHDLLGNSNKSADIKHAILTRSSLLRGDIRQNQSTAFALRIILFVEF